MTKNIPTRFLVSIFIFFLGLPVFGQFELSSSLSYGFYGANDVKTGDLDNDGDIDIVASSYVNDEIIWFEQVNGAFLDRKIIIDVLLAEITSIQLKDMDGDGNLDILFSSYDGDKISWIKNLGNQNFSSDIAITTLTNGATSVYSTDLDGDGDLDVLSSSFLDDKIAWYENLGAGNFGPQQLISSSIDKADQVLADDFDNDGDMDVIAFTEYDGDIYLFENLGAGSFSSGTIITSSVGSRNRITTGDLNQDGFAEVITAIRSTTGNVLFAPNLGNLSFGTEQTLLSYNMIASEVVVADLDLDGDLDLITCNDKLQPLQNTTPSDSLFVLENLGGGVFSSPTLVALIEPTSSTSFTRIETGDLNGDGYPEILFSYAGNSSNNAVWIENLSGMNFGTAHLLNREANSPKSVITADINQDGWEDVISVSYSDGKLSLFPNQNGQFQEMQVIQYFGRLLEKIRTGDMDNDGDFDLVVGTSDTTLWYCENIGGGIFANASLITSSGYRTNDLALEDLNGDNLLDIIAVTKIDNKVSWYPNLGNGIFGAQQLLTNAKANPRGVTSFDLDQDGDMDIVATSNGYNQIFSFINDGTGTFTGPNDIAVIFKPTDIEHADIDMDGMEDILVGRTDFYKDFFWLKNLGNGLFSSPQMILNNIIDYDEVRVDDLDMDGDIDVLLFTSQMNFAPLMWVENLGGGHFGAATVIDSLHFTGTSMAIFDADNDGDKDVVGCSFGDDNISVYKNKIIDDFQIHGRLYIDLNQNNVYDSTDQPAPQFMVQSTGTNTNSFFFQDGRYFFSYDTTGTTHTVTPGSFPYWQLISDSSSYTFTVDGNFQSIDSADFGFYPDSIITIVEPDLVAGWPRCNTVINFWTNLINTGTTFPSGIIEVVLHDSITFNAATVLPDSIVGNSIFWHFDSLNYFDSQQQLFQALMPGVSMLNIPMNSYLNIHILDNLGNIDTTFTDTLTQFLNCAYDPNDKQSDPVGIGSQGYISPNEAYLDYLIRFQNTGNDVAEVVVIKDQLSPLLQWETLERLSSSHFDYYTLDSTGLLTITFNNINLPDSTTDWLNSQGYFKFRIHLNDSLSIGTQIQNTAQIYFDFNPAISTNTKINTIYGCQENLTGLNDQTLCAYETLLLDGPLFETAYTWNLTGIISDSASSNIQWTPDTTGVFILDITAFNNICSLDTTLAITVTPGILPQMLDTTTICFGQSAMIFGQMQNVSGTYSMALQGSNGCDSILQKHLIVMPFIPINSIDTTFICSGETTILFGQTVMNSGVYYDTLSAFLGCDSIISKTLMVYPDYTTVFYQSTSLCDGDTLVALGQSIISAGLYNDTLTSISGCDSIVGINVMILPSYSNQTDTLVICEGDSVQFGGINIGSSGFYSDTLSTFSGCDSISSIQLNILSLQDVIFSGVTADTLCINDGIQQLPLPTPSGGTFSGNGISGDMFDPILADTGLTIVTYTYVDSLGCESIGQLSYFVESCAEIPMYTFDNSVRLFPNPANTTITIQSDQKILSITIRDISEKLVWIQEFDGEFPELSVDISNLSSGLYTLEISMEKVPGAHRMKFIKSNDK